MGDEPDARAGRAAALPPRPRRAGSLGTAARALPAAVLLLAAAPAPTPALAEPVRSQHPWPRAHASGETLQQRFPPPAGFVRRPSAPDGFASWLRALPMKPAGAPVLLHNGARKGRQDVHAGVIDIDTGERDLQQCADAVMRLRAEWLWSIGASDRIAFDYTGGGRVSYARFARGERPSASGKSWTVAGKADPSYAGFRRYMTNVFSYAGTYSLERELKPVPAGATPEVGDVIVKGGFPGHAVLVADVVDDPRTGATRFLLVQSYMPAQDMHVLKNPAAADGSPWYEAPPTWPLVTPEWTFPAGSLKRWP